uniref:Structural polyprotein n=1 Tax=Perth bee virus 1 TaxID=2201295 RepID=A0A2U8JQA9_9VIRU|nr:structural polyprotein [Perth bee virus 1]
MAVTEESFVSPTPQDPSEVLSASDNTNHSIISYLKRPRVVKHFTWSSTNKSNDILWEAVVPEILLDTMNKQKLDGFGTFSATTVLTFQINAQPFHQGLLLLYSRPSDSILGDRGKWCDNNCSNAMLLPNKIFDISTTSEVQIRVPYNSPLQEYNLITKQWPWSSFKVMVLTPFNTVSTSNIEINVFGHFEDIHLGAPTTMPIAQVGGESLGPVSSVTSQIGAITKMLSSSTKDYLPGLAGILNKGTDISEALTSLISALGFSKPLTAIPPQVVLQRPTQYTATVDGCDSGLPLSFNHNNAIAFKENFAGSTADECALDYVLKMPNLIYQGTYNINDQVGKQLFKTMLCPTWMLTTNSTKTETNSTPLDSYASNIMYWSSLCKYWRGGFKFTIRFARCNYISGRLALVYSPYGKVTSNSLVDRSEYAYKLILDLRKQTEFTFNVPYIATTHYKLNPLVAEEREGRTYDPLNPGQVDAHDMYTSGCLSLQVLTPLQANQSILPPHIDFIVEVSAADDFEIACPVTNVCVPFSDLDISSIPVAQVGTIGATGVRDTRQNYISGSFQPQDVTGKPLTNPTPIPAQECIGERFNSLRELCKRFSWHRIADTYPVKEACLLPKLIKVGTSYYLTDDTKTKENAEDSNMTVSYYSYIANCYAYRRGGIYLKNVNTSTSKQVPITEYTFGQSALSPRVYETKAMHELFIPFYSRVSYIPVNQKSPANTLVPLFNITHNGGDKMWGICGADDTDFGYYIGPPRHIIRNYGGAKPKILSV